jgi:homogentisate 1,2-dioxygenase
MEGRKGRNDLDLMKLNYQTGFGNEFATEAVEGALPRRDELSTAGTSWVLGRTVVGHGVYGTA